MALSAQPSEQSACPSAAWLLCAACGPLREEWAELAGFSLREEPGLLFTARCYEVEIPVAFPVLRRWVRANPALLEDIERIETIRSQDNARKRPFLHAEIAGSARAALLLGQGKAFLRHYKDYIQERAYEWHPDPGHTLFWDRVLGPGWEGGEAVPAGAAREEIVLLSANAYAFFKLPAGGAKGTGLCGAPADAEWLELATALRVADAEALEERSAAGSEAARVAASLLAGEFELARKGFEQLFGRAQDTRYTIVHQHGAPLLIYALVCGVLTGGSVHFLRAWFESARYALQYMFPASMASEQAQLMSFLDHLEQVDAVVNRNATLALAPQFNGALSRLPYAIFQAALPASVWQEVRAEELPEAVQTLADDGLTLLARYGEAGLRSSNALSEAHKAALAAVLEGERGMLLPPLPAPVTQRALEALVACVQKNAGSSLEQQALMMPPTLPVSRTLTGVIIDLRDEEQLEEFDSSAALRCMKKYACDGLLLLEGMSSAEFTQLFVSLQAQVEFAGSLALPGEAIEEATSQAVLLLSHEGGSYFCAALRLRMLPGINPLMTPGCGVAVPVVVDEDGRSRALCRDLEAEWTVIEKTVSALCGTGCELAEGLLNGLIPLFGFAELAGLLRSCREIGLECCWQKNHALQLYQPQGGLRLCPKESHGSWWELGGGLPVDEGRVLELSTLLAAFARHSGDTLQLGENEYVLLTPALERQRALLELVWQEKRGKQGVSAAALPLLEAFFDAPPAAEAPLELPATLQATLRPYQAEGYRWLVQRVAMGLGALLADDMGLGKTVQVLALLLHVATKAAGAPFLVVAPVSLLANWAAVAARFAPGLMVLSYDPRYPDALAALDGATLVLASYGQVVARLADFSAVRWEVLVLDEAQGIKNPDSQRAHAICSLSARSRLCLTGTPIENSLLDLWSQMRFLNPGLFGSRASFLRRTKKTKENELTLLRQVLAPLVLRRTKSEVLTQLPPLTETVEWIEFSPEERALYESLRRSAVKKLEQGNSSAGGVGVLAELTQLRRACCHGKLVLADFAGHSAKLMAMAERLQELRAAGRRVLVFSQFTDVLDLAQRALQGAGITFLRMDGSTPAAQRNKAVTAFQRGRADAFLISLKAGGAGLNLTAADYVILLDPWWNPAVESQAAGRSHRMGQRQPVTLCRFVVRGTVEERILELHRDKEELARSILGGSGEGLSLKALRDLLTEGR